MIHKKIIGTGVALVTPFHENGQVDFESLQNLVNFVIAGGVEFVVALGTTAETATLSETEKLEVLEKVHSTVANRCGVVVGAGGNNTAAVVSFVKSLSPEKFDAILSVAPYYNKPNQRGIYAHFEAIASSTSLPIILYNVPGRTSSNILPETVIRLANDFQNIVAIKEASGNLNQIMEIIQNRQENFYVLSGDDALTLPILSVGGDGVISVVANAYPDIFSTLVREMINGGDRYQALRNHYQLLEITNALFKDGNPAGIKALLSIKGLVKNVLRLPMMPVQSELFIEMERLNKKIG
ncbi:MAG: 4-hydroxy-tetrahydrodipicolinate synthase [Bacteroidales bacterium]|nr:4-hydroxy-tetrahydrodipicolinate synthase [Bacteroidales bacterium]